MKPGGPIRRKKELKRTSGLARGGGLGRSAPLARGKPLERTPMQRRPADNHLTADDWERIFRLLLMRSGDLCEGRTSDCLAPAGRVAGMPRGRLSIQHRRAQGAGGTSTSEANSLANLLILCGSGVTGCHGWVECQQRAAAENRGLWVRHTYEDGVLVPVWRYPLVLSSGRRVFLHPDEPRYVERLDQLDAYTRLPAVLAG